jgi:hypothetical protein
MTAPARRSRRRRRWLARPRNVHRALFLPFATGDIDAGHAQQVQPLPIVVDSETRTNDYCRAVRSCLSVKECCVRTKLGRPEQERSMRDKALRYRVTFARRGTLAASVTFGQE